MMVVVVIVVVTGHEIGQVHTPVSIYRYIVWCEGGDVNDDGGDGGSGDCCSHRS